MKELGENMEAVVTAARAGGLRLHEVEEQLRRRFLLQELRDAKGNICRAARSAGVHRNTMDRWCQHLGITPAALRPNGRRPVASQTVIRSHSRRA